MKEEILKLRSEGKSYDEIVKLLGCSKSTISYYCNPSYKTNAKKRNAKNKKENKLSSKVERFKRANRRLKSKSERFQHRDNSFKGNRKPYDKEYMKFNWKDIFTMIEENPKCYLTGDKLDLENQNNIALDHKVPVSKGGSNELSNLGICTSIANQSKSSMTVEEYIQLCIKVLTNFGYTVTK